MNFLSQNRTAQDLILVVTFYGRDMWLAMGKNELDACRVGMTLLFILCQGRV